MSFCCSQCDFTAHFESALVMHHQLHHEGPGLEDRVGLRRSVEKAKTLPMMASFDSASSSKESKGYKLGARSSATRLFDKLKARICRSRQALAVHQEEGATSCDLRNGHPVPSECTSKGLKFRSESAMRCPRISELTESYGCHLCPYVADRITTLDRHLLNDHQIGLDNLLKLVMAKTKDGLEDKTTPQSQSYYSPRDEDEYVVETVTPRIKVLKNTGTNTDTVSQNMGADLTAIKEEMDQLLKFPIKSTDKTELSEKMRVLNDCMCQLADNTKCLRRVFRKDSTCGRSVREFSSNVEEPRFDLGLGDQDTPRSWEKALSENMDRRLQERPKYKTDSFYY